MITLQTRRVYVGQQRPGVNEGWRDLALYPDFLTGRPGIMKRLRDLGFTPFSEVCLLVDELNPARYIVPEWNVLTEDNGNEVRVVDDRAEPSITAAEIQLADFIRIEGEVFEVLNRTPAGVPVTLKLKHFNGRTSVRTIPEDERIALVDRKEQV